MLENTDSNPNYPPRIITRRRNDWTLKEHEVVVTFWPDVSAIQKALPHRSRIAIVTFAGKCNLRREQHIWTGAEDSLLRRRISEGVPRKAIARELKLQVGQIQNRMRYARLRYAKRGPKPTGNKLMDAVFRRAFDMNLSRNDLDAISGKDGKQFSKWSPARKICIRRINRVVEYLGGSLSVTWEDDQ